MHAWDKQQSIKSTTVSNSYKCSKSQSLLSSTPVSLWMKAGGKMKQTPLSSALTGSHGAGWASRGPSERPPDTPANTTRSRRGSRRVLAGSLKHRVSTSRLYTLLLSQWSWVLLIWMFCLQLFRISFRSNLTSHHLQHCCCCSSGGFWKNPKTNLTINLCKRTKMSSKRLNIRPSKDQTA